jgi:uncharacterized protein YdaU (DUF1376 family)
MPAEVPSRARFPYMPFYVDDWLSSDAVEGMTLEQQGAYLNLLLRQWKAKDGMLPTDDATLARWSRLGARWRKVGKPILAQCFVTRNGSYVNPKLYGLWERSRGKSGQATTAAEVRWEEERKRKLRRDAIWTAMLTAYNRCLRCGRSDVQLARDHIIPRHMGGEDTPQNWQPLCRACNSSKGRDCTDHRVGLPETDPSWLPPSRDRDV